MTPSEAFRDAIWKANNGYQKEKYLLSSNQSAFDFEQIIKRNNRLSVIEKNNQTVTVRLS